MRRFLSLTVAWCVLAGAVSAADIAAPKAPPKPASQEEQKRIDTIEAIGEKGQASAEEIAGLVADLKDRSPLIRGHAAHALGMLGERARSAAKPLAMLAADPNPMVRREVVRALLKIGPDPAVTRPIVNKLLNDADPALRTQILHTMADVGKPVVPRLIQALKDDGAAKYACLVLAEIGPDASQAVPALLERLKIDKRPEVRQQVVMALGAIRSAQAVPALIEVLNDPACAARIPAAFAVGQIGPEAKAAQASLAQCAKAADPVLKLVASWAMVKVNPGDAKCMDQAVTAIVEALVSKNVLARTAAFRALVDLRPGPDRVLPAIQRHLEGANKEAVAEALYALASIGEPAVPALVDALKLVEYRPLIASILAHIGPPAKSAVPALIDVVKTDKAPAARREALLALGAIGSASAAAVPAVTAALDDPNEPVALAACYALQKIGPDAKSAIPALKKLAGGKDETLRKAATEAMRAVE